MLPYISFPLILQFSKVSKPEDRRQLEASYERLAKLVKADEDQLLDAMQDKELVRPARPVPSVARAPTAQTCGMRVCGSTGCKGETCGNTSYHRKYGI